MKKISLILFLILYSCGTNVKVGQTDPLKITVGSCNDQEKEEENLWQELQAEKSDYFVWLGDIIYPKADDFESVQEAFIKLKNNQEYQRFAHTTKIIGTWDDHDYGMNDGGVDNPIKQEVKQELLHFLDVPSTSDLYQREGMYHAYKLNDQVKVVILDTRYFRSSLTKSTTDPEKRYMPNEYGEGTMLGEKQWQWLEKELKDSSVSVTLVISSIQVLNNFHGYEKWGNMPHERERLLTLLTQSKSKAIVISGDRHFSEISQQDHLVELTSSGLNKVYSGHSERNPLRVSSFVNQPTYGVIEVNEHSILIQMKGKDQVVFDSFQIKL